MKIYLFMLSLILAANVAFAQAQPVPNSGLTRVEMVKDKTENPPVQEKRIIRKAMNLQTGEVLYREVVTQKELDTRKAAKAADKAANPKRDRIK